MLHNLTFGADSFFHSEAQVAQDERRNAIEEKIVQLGARLTADFYDVFEPRRGNERNPCAFSLQKSVGSDRSTVEQRDLSSSADFL